MSYERKEHQGAAAATTLAAGINGTATTITITSATGWPTGSPGEFYAVIDRGEAAEEKILVQSRSGTTLTLASSAKRGVDGTSAASHSSGATIEHCVSATELDEANSLVNQTLGSVTAVGDLLVGSAAGTIGVLPKGTQGHLLQVDTAQSLDLKYGVLPTGAISSSGMFAAGVVDAAAIATDAVGTAEIAANAVTSSELADNAVDTAAIADDAVTNAKIADDAVAGAQIADAAVGTAHLIDGAVTVAKLADVPCCRVRRATDQTLTDDTATAVSFSHERYDTDTMWVVGTPTRVTINTAGVYRITGNVRFATDTAGYRQLYLRVNGATVIAAHDTGDAKASAPERVHVSTEWEFAATDYVELIAWQNSGGSLAVEAVTAFSPELAVTYQSGPTA